MLLYFFFKVIDMIKSYSKLKLLLLLLMIPFISVAIVYLFSFIALLLIGYIIGNTIIKDK